MITQPRPRPFLVNKLAQMLAPDERSGRVRAAGLAGVSLDVFNKACTERDLTVGAMSTFIGNVGKIHNDHNLDAILNELTCHFIPPRRKLIFVDLIEDYERSIGQSTRFLDALRNGGRLAPVVMTELCNTCDSPVQFIKICATCQRGVR